MTTLKENISARFEFDSKKIRAMGICEDTRGLSYSESELNLITEGAEWQHNQLKNEMLPILLDMVSAIETMCDLGIDTSTDGGREFINEALERLRKWSEG